MAEVAIKLLPIKHDEKNSRHIPVQDQDLSEGPKSSPADAVTLTDPTLSSENITDSRADDDGSGGEKKTDSSMSLMQKLTFVGIAITYLTNFMSFSVISPFFPYELPVIGAKFMFLSGNFVSSGCNILFGFLDRIGGKTTFLVYCFVIRVVEAVGSAATLTSGMAICANVYPEKVAQMTGLLQIISGLGIAVGPPIGGLFYGIGGYQLPFLILGGISIAFTILNIFILPSLTISDDEDGGAGSFTEVLKIPAIWVAWIACMLNCACLGFINPTLALHLTSPPLNGNPSLTGVFFLFLGGIFGIFAPVCGYVADKKQITRSMMVVGSGLTGISFMLLGPSPILHIQGQLWIVILSLLLLGFGMAFALNQTFLDILISASWYGLSDSLSTQSIVSGLYNGAYSSGALIGPVGGGALVEKIGFNWSVTYIAGGNFVMMIMLCLFGAWEFQCGKG